uniref:Transposase n=1 Tax=Candidatus Kentrum sp. TC TaxID=2126339 RepID=A0A450ZUG0_9GAMM|nr:MAG: hypothetical protein BECKTC1821F_GA0114240_101755 [Candidatus Kentron sp. TC]
MWGIKVFFVYTPRRVNCPSCGIRVEQMPWVNGKYRLTNAYSWFLAGWAKRLSWKEVGEAFHTTWYHVFFSVHIAVTWGLEHRELFGIQAIGINEIQWRRGHHYLTLVYRIDAGCRRLLWIGKSTVVAQLVSGQRPILQWHRRGLEQESKTHDRKAYGFRTYHSTEIALYHALGNLPVPESTHKFF